MGDIGVFSFHPRKSITTGEGGMVTTNDGDLAHKMDVMRNHGGSPTAEQLEEGPKPHLMHDYDELGYNYRMTDIQAAVGLVQLGKLDRYIEERDRGARRYAALLSKLPWLRLPYQPNGMRHAWQAYVTMVDPAKAPRSRNEIMAYLSERGVATRPGTHAVHMLGLYVERFGLKPDDLPRARDAYLNSMAIPLHNRMSEEDFEYVADCINSV
jgi:dTDP-4-amino-4,6-dideoxygalactose transaminase